MQSLRLGPSDGYIMEKVCAGGRAQPNGLSEIPSAATDRRNGMSLPHADAQLLPFHNSPVIQSRSETLSGGLGLRLLFMTRSHIQPGREEKEEKQR